MSYYNGIPVIDLEEEALVCDCCGVRSGTVVVLDNYESLCETCNMSYDMRKTIFRMAARERALLVEMQELRKKLQDEIRVKMDVIRYAQSQGVVFNYNPY